jgi:hypothetical protein
VTITLSGYWLPGKQAREVERHHLVADELVDDRVVTEDIAAGA